MKPELQAKFLQYLHQKRGNEGFTLIELLVVVIIVGVLAAIALPNLLGQVGRAREAEARNMIGTLNRAQQAEYTESAEFASTIAALEVPTGNENYYSFSVENPGVQYAEGLENEDAGTRDYIGAVAYSTNDRQFSSVVCRATNNPTFTLDPGTDDAPTAGSGATTTAACGGSTEEVE